MNVRKTYPSKIMKPYVCYKCDKQFCKYMLLKVHMQVHKSDEVPICVVKDEPEVESAERTIDECTNNSDGYEENVLDLGAQNEHSDSHIPIKDELNDNDTDLIVTVYQVEQSCPEIDSHHVVAKRRSKKAGIKPTNTCEICLKSFSRTENLRRHMRTHTGEKPLKCESCDKYFSDLSNLAAHRKVHTGIKPYKCEDCHKCFSRNDNLKKHMQVHTGERPYKCEDCRKCFSRNEDLKRHLEVHAVLKPYKCEHCLKYFSQSVIFEAHTRTRECQKQYQCEVCLKCFNRSENLKRHMSVHTGEKLHKCHVCDRYFCDASSLKNHQKTRVHQKVQESKDRYSLQTDLQNALNDDMYKQVV